MVGFSHAADNSSGAAAKARNNGWVENGNNTDLFGRKTQELEPPPFSRVESADNNLSWREKIEHNLRRTVTRTWTRVRSLGKASKAVVTHPHRSILLTKERKAEKQKLKARQRPKRIHFKLPKQRSAQLIKALDPDARPVERWLMLMVLPLAFEMWAFPYRLGFGSPGGGNLFILLSDVVCDSIFLVDAAFSLFIRIPANTYPNQLEAITRIRRIAPERVKRDFPWLFIPAIIYYVREQRRHHSLLHPLVPHHAVVLCR